MGRETRDDRAWRWRCGADAATCGRARIRRSGAGTRASRRRARAPSRGRGARSGVSPGRAAGRLRGRGSSSR
ncbi:hypothetical protein DSP71_12480, partial [Microbacterium sp. H6]